MTATTNLNLAVLSDLVKMNYPYHSISKKRADRAFACLSLQEVLFTSVLEEQRKTRRWRASLEKPGNIIRQGWAAGTQFSQRGSANAARNEGRYRKRKVRKLHERHFVVGDLWRNRGLRQIWDCETRF